MKVLIAMSLAAAHDYGVALGAALGKRTHTVIYAAGGIAAEMLARSGTAYLSGKPEQVMDAVRPNVFIACIAGGGKDAEPIEIALAQEANERNIPWTLMEDTAGVASQPAFTDMLWSHHPALVCLTDQSSADRFKLTHPEIPEGDVEVVGNPTWDAALRVDRGVVRQAASDSLGLSRTDYLVVYMAGKVGGVERTRAVLEPLVRSLCAIDQDRRYHCWLAPLFHSGDPEWRATLEQGGSPYGCFDPVLTQAKQQAGLGLISKVEIAEKFGTDLVPVLAAADAFVSTASADNTRAVLLRTPVIRPLFPLDRKMLETLGYESPHYFSDVALGCSLAAYSELGLLAALDALLAPNASTRRLMRENQALHFSAPGDSITDRIVEMLEHLVK